MQCKTDTNGPAYWRRDILNQKDCKRLGNIIKVFEIIIYNKVLK